MTRCASPGGKTRSSRTIPYLAPDPGAPARGRADYPLPETADIKEDVERCCALVPDKGLEMPGA